MKRIVLLVALLALVACAPKPPFEVYVATPPPEVSVPVALRSCPSAPAIPGPDATQADVAEFIVRLHEAHRVCKISLSAVNRIIADYNASRGDFARKYQDTITGKK